MKKVAIAIHEHEHGSDGYIFAYESTSLPELEERVADLLKIDFEPDKGETLTLAPLCGVPGYSDPVKIDWLPLLSD